MIRTPVLLHHTHLLFPPEDPPDQAFLRAKELESLSLLKKCTNFDHFNQAHALLLKWGFFASSFIASNLLATCALSHWGSMDYACSIFREIGQPGSFDFNTMIKGYVSDLDMESALLIYIEMLERGIQSNKFTYPALLKACSRLQAIDEGMQIHGHIIKLGHEDDLYVQNSLITIYGKCGKIGLSCLVFDKIDHKDAATWSSLITAHSSSGLWCECLQLFDKMMNHDRSCRPEESLLVSVLSACSHLGAVDTGRCLHGYLLRNIRELNLNVQTSLMDMYMKCGCVEKGVSIFQRMIRKNKFAYSVMISGLAMHTRSRQALEVFSEMLDEGLEPDDAVYVGVLKACCQGGLVEEGLRYFSRMKTEHGIRPTIQHYGCLVDLFGRGGKLKEALEFIRSIPVEPNDVIWRSLLSACRAQNNLHIAEIAAKTLSNLNPRNPGDLLILSNMYARAQRWDDVARVRAEISHQGLIQTSGFCIVECNRKVYKFVSQDRSHPDSEDIYEMIHQMEWQLRFEGYSADTSEILLDVDDEEKRERLKGHCQKLAMAFALIRTPPGSPIRMARNVRMCKDCHTYTKFISSIYSREIVVRDRNQFHHFKDGACSCTNYW